MANLKAAVAKGNEGEIIEALRDTVESSKRRATISLVKKLAAETQSPALRNAAALALLDCGAPGTTELIIELVERSDTKGTRGTLLYVLNELDAAVPLLTIVRILAEESFEARAEALGLLVAAARPPGDVAPALSTLRGLINSPDREAVEHARDAIEILTSPN